MLVLLQSALEQSKGKEARVVILKVMGLVGKLMENVAELCENINNK